MTPVETPEVEVLQLLAAPVTAKLIRPLGARALAVPVTVAVKSSEPPSVGLAGLTVSTTVGRASATVVVDEEATAPTALYPLSPGKVKLAP
jgi:hypothetical protein